MMNVETSIITARMIPIASTMKALTPVSAIKDSVWMQTRNAKVGLILVKRVFYSYSFRYH